MNRRVCAGLMSILAATSHSAPLSASSIRLCPVASLTSKPSLQPEVITEAPRATCAAYAPWRVCRRATLPADNAPDTSTSTVAVFKDDRLITSWSEQGDPTYIGEIQSVLGRSEGKEWLVVGTLQSESQGLGRQEWIITAIDLSLGLPSPSRTYTSNDFDAVGSFVRRKNAPPSDCQLLLTRWDQRATAHGDRLFLLGNVTGIGSPTIEQNTLPDFQRRFDHKLERLRLGKPKSAPLVYFQR